MLNYRWILNTDNDKFIYNLVNLNITFKGCFSPALDLRDDVFNPSK